MSDRNRSLDRRTFLRRALLTGGGVAASSLLPCALLAQHNGAAAPAVIGSAASRPRVPYGVASGDILADRAVIWSRADRPARMIVEYATSDSFSNAHRIVGPAALANSDYTARLDLAGLPPDQEIFYRVMFEDLADLRTLSEPVSGRLRTAPSKPRPIRFLWSGDTAGQGWGINPEWGGMKIYEAMRQTNPDFFLHCGDCIYADGPMPAEKELPGGGVWKNVTTEAKSKVAETLDEFRGNYIYNLLDENLRRFNAEVPMIAQWDDHETTIFCYQVPHLH